MAESESVINDYFVCSTVFDKTDYLPGYLRDATLYFAIGQMFPMPYSAFRAVPLKAEVFLSHLS